METTNTRATLELRGHVAVVRMCDAANFNALSSQQVEAVLGVLDEARRKNARAFVIASDVKHFCAGGDMRDMLARGTLRPGSPPSDRPGPIDLFRSLQQDGRVVIAAVDGLAMGGGVELLLSSDLVLCSSKARLALPEIGWGVVPRTALMRLAEIVGRRRALELVLTRRRVDGTEAVAMGLANRLVASDELLDEACAMALQIISAPPAAIATVKRNMGRMANDNWPELDKLLSEMDAREWTEGFQSFLDKKDPDYEKFWNEAGTRLSPGKQV